MRVIRAAFRRGKERFGLRLVHFSVQRNHLHLIVEAGDKRALARGLQGLAVRLARGLNRLFVRRGKLFADRYHASVLDKPKKVRNALRYVLANAKHHMRPERRRALRRGWTDACSSAEFFAGYRDRPVSHAAAARSRAGPAAPVVAAHSWLLRKGWRRHGLLRLAEGPAP